MYRLGSRATVHVEDYPFVSVIFDQSRLSVYNDQTAPLIEYYTNKGVIFNVDGSTTPEAVHEIVSAKLDSMK